MSDVQMTLVDRIEWSDEGEDGPLKWSDDGALLRPDLAPGTASWLSDTEGNECSALEFVCPCGCGRLGGISIKQPGSDKSGWTWDGNKEKPTLSPSIQKLSPCRWHGHLVAGVFVPC